MRGEARQAPLSGNFTWRDEFDKPRLDRAWLQVRVPKTAWADLAAKPGALTIHPLAENLDTLRNPSFLARRQQHLVFEASTSLDAPAPGIAAGIAAFQNETHWYFLGARRVGGQLELFIEGRTGEATQIVASTRIEYAKRLQLKISGDKGAYAFAYAIDGKRWQPLGHTQDGTLLSTDVAGGFVGATLGPYARDERNR
jgi:alpha-N-arabinofuranosidase